jgi:hypothetical protein
MTAQIELCFLSSTSAAMSESFDDSNLWSTPEVYPLGRLNVVLISEHLDDDLTAGPHTVIFRFEESSFTAHSASTIKLSSYYLQVLFHPLHE